MKRTRIIYVLLFGLLGLAVFQGCKKSSGVVTPPEVATFAGHSGGTFEITSNDATFDIPVGFTTVSNAAREVNISITSTTGATEGTHYTLSSKATTVPAGSATASIPIHGILDPYLSGRKDTLIVKIERPNDLAAEGFDDTYVLVLRGPCFEGMLTSMNSSVTMRIQTKYLEPMHMDLILPP